MTPSAYALQSDDTDASGLGAALDDEINRFNVEATGLPFTGLLRICHRGPDGELWAGLAGFTWGGCAHIDVLWVHGNHRRSGVGSALLQAAEEEAGRRGCATMSLSTHTFQAPRFYARHGYVECGRTPNYPPGHAQVHLVKTLSGRAGTNR